VRNSTVLVSVLFYVALPYHDTTNNLAVQIILQAHPAMKKVNQLVSLRCRYDVGRALTELTAYITHGWQQA